MRNLPPRPTLDDAPQLEPLLQIGCGDVGLMIACRARLDDPPSRTSSLLLYAPLVLTSTMAAFMRPASKSYDSTYSPMESPFVTTLAYHPLSPVYFQGDGFPFPQTPPKPSPHFLSLSPTDSSWSSSSSASSGSQRSESSFASLTSGELPPSPPLFTVNPTATKHVPMSHPPTPHHEVYARSKNAGSTPGCAPPLPMPRCVSPTAAGKAKALDDDYDLSKKYKGVPDGWADRKSVV